MKRDTKGRVRRSLAHQEEILAEFDHSGLSAPAFAEVICVHHQTLEDWKKARAKQSFPTLVANSSWGGLEVEVNAPVILIYSRALNMRLPGGVQFQIHHASQVALAAQPIKSLS